MQHNGRECIGVNSNYSLPHIKIKRFRQPKAEPNSFELCRDKKRCIQ